MISSLSAPFVVFMSLVSFMPSYGFQVDMRTKFYSWKIVGNQFVKSSIAISLQEIYMCIYNQFESAYAVILLGLNILNLSNLL